MLEKFIGKVKFNSPKILLGTGIACAVGAVVMAHRAGRKIDETLDVDKKLIENTKELKDKEEIINEEGERVDYSPEQYKKDIHKAYRTTVVDVVKLYAPPVALLGASILCVVKGHKVMAIRLASATAAYEAANKAFNKYRENVIRMSGTDQDKKYLYGDKNYKSTPIDDFIKDEDIPEELKGKTFDVVKDVSNMASRFAVDVRCCPEIHNTFTQSMIYDIQRIKIIENEANVTLNERGIIYLSEIYDKLGVLNWITDEQRALAQSYGWDKSQGDDRVDINVVIGNVRNEGGPSLTKKEITAVDFNCVCRILDKYLKTA